MSFLRGALRFSSLAVLSGLGAASALAGQPPGLLSPEEVGRPGSSEAQYGRALATVVLRERTSIAVTATGSGIVEVARRDPSKATWLRRFSRVGPSSIRPLLARGPNGQIAAAWISGGRAVLSTRDPASGRWREVEALSDGGVSVVRLAAGLDGDILVAWVRDDRLYARLRRAGSERFGPLQAITSDPAQLTLSETPLLVDEFGDGAIAWSEQPLSERTSARVVERVALRPSGDDASWTTPEALPAGRSDQMTPPVLGADAAGTITAAWIEDGVVKTADRTSSGEAWMLDPNSVFASPPSLTSVVLTIEPSGRAVMAAIERVGPTLSAVRVASRDGSADRWNEAGVSPARRSSGTESLAIATTALGDAVVAHGRSGPPCAMTVTVLATGDRRRGDPAQVNGMCEVVGVSTDATGDVLVTGVGSDGTLRTALRPEGGLVLDLESAPSGRVRLRASAPSRVAITIQAGSKVVARRTTVATTGWRTLTISGLRSPGRYQVLAKATSGSAASRVETLPLIK